MVNQVNKSHNERSINGVNGYDSFKNHSDIDHDDKDSTSARTDNARVNIAALRENIMGSKDATGANRTNSVTHDFNDFETSFL